MSPEIATWIESRRWCRSRLESVLSLLAVALLACLPFGHTAADTIYMQNGDRFTGEVKKIWDDEVYIDTDYSEEFTVSLGAVARIVSSEEFEIELRDHRVVTGQLVADAESDMALLTKEGVLPLPPMAIEELVTTSEKNFNWEVRADVSTSTSTGNTETADFLLQLQGEVTRGDHRDRFSSRLDRKEQDGSAIKDQNLISYTHSWFFSDSWFVSGGIGFERDPIRELSYRYVPGIGIGYEFFNDASRHFEVAVSAVAVREEIGGIESESFAPLWSLRYSRDLLDGDMEFFHNHRIWRYVSGRTNEVVHTTTGIRWDVWGDIYLNAQLNWNRESEPAEGFENEDVTYLLGVGFELD